MLCRFSSFCVCVYLAGTFWSLVTPTLYCIVHVPWSQHVVVAALRDSPLCDLCILYFSFGTPLSPRCCRYGADPSLKTQSGASAIKLAADFGHAEVAAWIEAAVAGWSPLRVCVEARFHWVAASMLASGEADGYLGSAGAAARLMRRARSSKPGMPLVQGVPKCLTTCQVIDAAMGPWRPKNHALFGPKFRELVRFLLMVRHRISYTGPAGRCMSPVALGMPLLPVEMWLAIISHIPRQEIDGPCAEARPLGMFAVSCA